MTAGVVSQNAPSRNNPPFASGKVMSASDWLSDDATSAI
jgi:hypothetical protein